MPHFAPTHTRLSITILVLVCCAAPAWASGGHRHTVRPGQTLGGIARANGCTVSEVMGANPSVKDVNHIRIGQRLAIPQCTAGGPALNCRWRSEHIESTRLRSLMKAQGFSPPQKFRALVIKTTLSKDLSRVERHQLWDYDGLGAT
ncbi:MAG: LysM peptidoglycan-binding domain-containing protein, partial [Myxococcota bacterium]|nr:LysM peptidoglycan-binding domain-containing protein [Myxococcota bacterium]